jgi:hypothetical protein
MMIVDAISSAQTPPAVYFLVTAYLESLRHFEHGVDEGVLHLPVAGAGDLAGRVRLLRCSRAPADDRVITGELEAVLGAALARLDDLGETELPVDAASAPARSDTLHSSLSV